MNLITRFAKWLGRDPYRDWKEIQREFDEYVKWTNCILEKLQVGNPEAACECIDMLQWRSREFSEEETPGTWKWALYKLEDGYCITRPMFLGEPYVKLERGTMRMYHRVSGMVTVWNMSYEHLKATDWKLSEPDERWK